MGKHLGGEYAPFSSPEAQKRRALYEKQTEIAAVIRDMADVGQNLHLPQNVIETAEGFALAKGIEAKKPIDERTR